MNAPFFLSLHVLAAILTIGPVAVAASMFPRYVRATATASADGNTADGNTPDGTTPDGSAATILGVLHRICRVYTVIGLTVPAFGLATAAVLGVLTDGWLLTSILLTAIAAAVLLFGVLPHQARALTAANAAPSADPADPNAAKRLGMLTGVFNLLWAVVVVLMIVRPGSTTGV